ncbi:globin domain-containing protein [Poseidonibacter ostreae]|uniref:Globin n=1 Tax=Poseidonibacter ostreae TaxID=2654171 RepID=A0A6L4WPP4_9BACT|nr:globin [Poseidonibacter ostreae]KAB7885365.1 globin [Poseidonibacter ostreae]KAB7885768.1 globin [Poseidonibacter ostreae]KAB7893003.1 globin [Poseidonibacter ostreae]MAC85124.1 globin [Arcobacter sp.]
MNYHVSKTTLGENPKFEYPKPIFLEEMGEEGLKKLFSEFYDLIVDSDIGNFFPQDEEELEKVKAHNVKFFIEAAGGPKDYTKAVGHFDMLKTHEQFSITEKARREWLGTMEEVLRKTDISDEAKQSFWDFLETFSKHTVNVDEKQELEDLVVKKG